MTIHLSKEQQQFVHDAVRAGLYGSEDEVIRDALARLEKALPRPAKPSGKEASRKKAPPAEPKKSVSVDELHREMMASGLILRLPDPSLDANDDDPDDQPVTIKVEPLSETILRERR